MTNDTATTAEVTVALKFFLSAPPGLAETYACDDENFVCRKVPSDEGEGYTGMVPEPNERCCRWLCSRGTSRRET